MPASQVQVIVVAYNSGQHLQRCVSALLAQTYTDFSAVIWDNASTDGAVKSLRADDRFCVIDSIENIGFAAANNRAAAMSRSHYIATLNPDAFPEPEWLEMLVATAERYGADAVGSLQIADDNPNLLDGAGDCMSIAGIAWRGGYLASASSAPRRTCEVFAACAAAALYRRQSFEALGGFEERFFCYFEDVDLGFRLRLAGGRTLLEPASVVRHVGSASSGRQSEFAEYHGARNRLWTLMRDMPLVLMPIAIPSHLLVLTYVFLRSPRLLRPRLRGVRDAWRARHAFIRERTRGGLSWPLLRSLTWSPISLSRRAIKSRPV